MSTNNLIKIYNLYILLFHKGIHLMEEYEWRNLIKGENLMCLGLV